ncbi:MAG: MFS transporter [Bacteriovoracaceae bacterium]|nr:MFS transporter [Bacteriovoracaceae bacterium]
MVSYIKSLERDIQLQRVVTFTSLGTLFHWYCFYALSSILPYIFRFHLSLVDESVSFMSWMAIALGFFVRPLGTLMFAPRIDLFGRKSTYASSLNLLAASVLMVVVFPFDSAPISLSISIILLSRLLQGIAISMEYGAAISYIYESVPKEKAGFFTGILQLTAPIGFLGALLMNLISTQMVSDYIYHYWFWKFPLIIGLVLFFLSNRIRSDLPESPMFELMKRRQELSLNPLSEIFKSKLHRKNILFAIFSVTAAQGASYYLMHTFIINYLATRFSLTEEKIKFFMIALITLSWPLAIIVAKQLDKSKSRPLFLKILMTNFIMIPSLFYLLELFQKQGVSYWSVFIPVVILYMGSISIYAVTGKLLADLFPTPIRGTAISIPYHIGNGIFGGLIPILTNISMQGNDLNPWPVLSYVCALILLAIFMTTRKINV